MPPRGEVNSPLRERTCPATRSAPLARAWRGALRCGATTFLVVSLIRISSTLGQDVGIHGHRHTPATTVLTRDEPYLLARARLRAHRRSLDCGIARGLASLARS